MQINFKTVSNKHKKIFAKKKPSQNIIKQKLLNLKKKKTKEKMYINQQFYNTKLIPHESHCSKNYYKYRDIV